MSSGFGDAISRAEAMRAAEQAEAETAYRNQLAAEAFERGRDLGRAENVYAADRAMAWHMSGPMDPEMIDTINKHAAGEHARIEECRWGPGGRAHFGDPRPGDFPGRDPRPEPEQEAQAG